MQITACNNTRSGYNTRNWTKHGKLPYVTYTGKSEDVKTAGKSTGGSSGNTGGSTGGNTGSGSSSLKFSVGQIVNFSGSVHYVTEDAATGPAAKPGKAKITKIVKGGKHPYHIIHVDSSSNVYGWVDAADVGAAAPAAENWTPAVGDIVNFTGSVHYSNANAATGPSCKPGKAKITQIYLPDKSKHPYHLKAISGSSSTVYGWVDRDAFTKS